MATGESLEAQLEARDPDVRLMLQIRDDVPGAFEVLVERYQHRLVGVLTHLIGRVDEAEDLTQEVFLRIYRARKGYKPKAKFSTWLFTIANNLAMNHLRGRAGTPPAPSGWGGRPGLGFAGRAPAAGGAGPGPRRDALGADEAGRAVRRRPRGARQSWAKTRSWRSCSTSSRT